MKRDSDNHIIPKIIVILGTVTILGIILLFFRPRELTHAKKNMPKTPTKLFTQVIKAAIPKILKLWEEGDQFIITDKLKCDDEILFSKKVARSYYQCQPHFWQCFWSEGVGGQAELEVDIFGQTFHVIAIPSFDPISSYSKAPRFYQTVKTKDLGLKVPYAYQIEIKVREIPKLSQSFLLTDSCRDVLLPERVYAYGSKKDLKKNDDGFIWDNFDRKLYLDKFYVSNQKVNEWRLLTNKLDKIINDRTLWPMPALLNLDEQNEYCHFFGKRLLEAKLFDAATMTPADLKNPKPMRPARPETPWQRDISRTFLGLARINPDYQLTPLDCQLAQVEGCPDKYFSTDSSTWMGFNFGLGFYPESLDNNIHPQKNLKKSSRFLAPSSPMHELGVRSFWKGDENPAGDMPIAFRCYEEVYP